MRNIDMPNYIKSFVDYEELYNFNLKRKIKGCTHAFCLIVSFASQSNDGVNYSS